MLENLVFGNRPAELLALPRIFERLVEHRLHHTAGLRAHRGGSLINEPFDNRQAFALLADQRGGGHGDFVQDDMRRISAIDRTKIATLTTCAGRLDEEYRHALNDGRLPDDRRSVV